MVEQKTQIRAEANGETTIDQAVLAAIAGMAAKEVKGVISLGSSTIRRAIADTVGGASKQGQGIKVEAGKKEAIVDLQLNIEYGYSIPEVVKQVRNKISERLEEMAGLTTKEMNIHVVGIVFNEGEKHEKRVE